MTTGSVIWGYAILQGEQIRQTDRIAAVEEFAHQRAEVGDSRVAIMDTRMRAVEVGQASVSRKASCPAVAWSRRAYSAGMACHGVAMMLTVLWSTSPRICAVASIMDGSQICQARLAHFQMMLSRWIAFCAVGCFVFQIGRNTAAMSDWWMVDSLRLPNFGRM